MEATVFEIGVVAQFEAAHSLRGDFGPASRRHGHTYRVEVGARGASLREDGTLCDISLLQRAVQEATASLHYRDLNELRPFEAINSTAEAVARWLFEQVVPHLSGQELASLQVRVWESPAAWAGYEGEIPA